MSSEQNTLYPALRQIAAAVLENYQPAPCEVCQGQPTTPYVLAYGKQTSRESSTVGNTTTTVTKYENLTARAVSLCEPCVKAHQQVMIKRSLLWLAVAILITLVFVAVLIFGGEDGQITGIIGAMLSGMVAIYFVSQWHINRTQLDRVGRNKALRLHMDALKAQGYDAFWTDEVA